MSICHQFSTEHAMQYGLREAVLLQNLHFWIGHNHANGTHWRDGRTWTYNSVSAFEDLFPYLTYKQIRTSLETLTTMGVLVRGNYNERPSDRTTWYTFTEEFLAQNPLPPRANGSALGGKSLTNTDRNPDVTLIPATPAGQPGLDEPPEPPKPPEPPGADAARTAALRLATWESYRDAYQSRYGIEPVRNSTTNSQVALLVKRVGKDVPDVAVFYVQRVSEQFIVAKCHPLGLLLGGAEGYYTQWATNQAITTTRARQIDQSQSNFDAAGEAMAIRRAKQQDKNNAQ